jgi:hypothetical protein
MSINAHGAGGDVVKPGNETGNGRFSGTGPTDDRGSLSRLD